MPISPLSFADEQTIAKLRGCAVRVDWEVAFDGKSAGNRHLERVARLADFLLDSAWDAGEEPDVFVTRAGAALHDTGLILGNRDHAWTGATICEALLRFQGIEEPRRSAIICCVRSHDYGTDEAASEPVVPATLEARIVHDADTLDKLGPLGAVRHTWKLSVARDRTWTAEELLAFLPSHLAERATHLHLSAAKEVAGRCTETLNSFCSDSSTAVPMLDYVMAAARAGQPTEAILASLRQTWPSSPFVAAAQAQLDLAYLDRPR